jgi:hypothetical protein
MPATTDRQALFSRFLKHAGCAAFIALAANGPARVEAGASALDVLAQREQIVDRFMGLPEPELKAVYMRCDDEAIERGMAFADALLCSIAYEALLQRSFNGDFDALLAWWRTQRSAAVPAAGPLPVATPAAPSAGRSPASGLEQAFWKCDYAARRTTMTRYQAEVCGVVIEGLRTEKFGGDIEKLLKWWEQHHAAEHRALEKRDAEQEYPLP